MRRLAERLREAIEQMAVSVPGTNALLRCTVTIGISHTFHAPEGFDAAIREADVALYRGKASGRNRIEWGVPQASHAFAAPAIRGGV